MNKFLKLICLILAVLSISVCVAACDEKTDRTDKAYYDYDNSLTGKGTAIKSMYVEREIDSMKAEDFVPTDKQSDFVLIKVKNYGSIVVLLREDVAPISVKNFKKLVAEKFYDNTVFHRVIESFMIQGGGSYVVKEDDGVSSKFEAKESEKIKGEFSSNGVENNLYHIRGVISMARANDMNSASSQFFIIHKTNESSANLNGNYASFGYVVAGMDVVDAIATCKVFGDANAPIPLEDVIMESVTFVEPKVSFTAGK